MHNYASQRIIRCHRRLLDRSCLQRFNDQRWFLRRAGIDESSESSSLQVKSFLPCSREHNKSRRWPTGRRMAAPRQKPHVAVEVPAEFTGSTSAALYAQYHANIQSLTPATAQVARSRRSVSRNDRRSIMRWQPPHQPPEGAYVATTEERSSIVNNHQYRQVVLLDARVFA